MDNIWILYWITRFDDIKGMLFGFQFILAVCILIFAFLKVVCLFSNENEKDDSYHSVNNASKTVLWIVVPLFVSSTVVKALIPSKDDAMLIAAGVAVTEVVQSEAAGRIASKSVGVIETWLDKQVEEKKEAK